MYGEKLLIYGEKKITYTPESYRDCVVERPIPVATIQYTTYITQSERNAEGHQSLRDIDDRCGHTNSSIPPSNTYDDSGKQ